LNPSVVEQIKLRATFLNAISSGSIVAAMVTPVVGVSLGNVQIAQLTPNWFAIFSACGFYTVLAIVLHMLAGRVLSRLG